MNARTPISRVAALAAVLVLGFVEVAPAQRGGFALGRHEIMIEAFKLNRDQERGVKTIMDDAGKTATPVREAILKARAGILGAIEAGRPQADIDAASKAYAVQSAAMAEIEMRALAKIMLALTPEQRANQAAVRSTFQLMRGAFLNRNWNEPPNPDKGY